MSKLLTRVQRIKRLARHWLETLRQEGFGLAAQRWEQRLVVALGRLDELARYSRKARNAALTARIGLQSTLDQVEAMQEAAQQRPAG